MVSAKRSAVLSAFIFVWSCAVVAPSLSSRTALADEPAKRSVLLVGNTVSGTISIIDERTMQNLGTINAIPDFSARMKEIKASVIRSSVYEIIRSSSMLHKFEPGAGERFVDDVFLSPGGERLYVSRGNLGDVVAFDLTTAGFPIVWRTVIENYKADHAALSPDGRRIVVSASLAKVAQVIDTETGKIVGSFETGTLPHQNDFSHDGKHIYNGSLGRLEMPDAPDFMKGERSVTVIDAVTLKKVRTYKFNAGVRPTVVTDDEKTMYLQLSHLNGVVKYDLTEGRVVSRNEQPFSDFALTNYPKKKDYPHDSAHHGLSLSGDGRHLCDAGTIDNTVTIISTEEMKTEAILPTGAIPYWSTTNTAGDVCFVSLSGDNSVAAIRFDPPGEIARIPVGRFPQRSRLGQMLERTVSLLGAP